MAIVIIQVFIPFLGFIPLGFMNITFIQVSVITASILLGTKDGIILGATWGITRLILAYSAPQSLMDTLVFQNPFITILPRMTVGLISGLIFFLLYKKLSLTLASILTGIIGSLTNTFTTLSTMFLLKSHAVANVYQISLHELPHLLMSLVFINGVPEAIVSAILVPVFVKTLWKYTKKQHF